MQSFIKRFSVIWVDVSFPKFNIINVNNPQNAKLTSYPIICFLCICFSYIWKNIVLNDILEFLIIFFYLGSTLIDLSINPMIGIETKWTANISTAEEIILSSKDRPHPILFL
jgi:hypothetical protein